MDEGDAPLFNKSAQQSLAGRCLPEVRAAGSGSARMAKMARVSERERVSKKASAGERG